MRTLSKKSLLKETYDYAENQPGKCVESIIALILFSENFTQLYCKCPEVWASLYCSTV